MKSEPENSTDPQSQKEKENQEIENTERQFTQERYRWVIVSLVAFAMIINGFLANTVLSITSKMITTYSISDVYASAPVFAGFLAYSLANLPANYYLESKGLRKGFIVGTGFYLLGTIFFIIINQGYFFAILGSILIAMGKPFIINCSAKVAATWFNSKNRTVATAVLTGTQFIGVSLGYLTPPLSIDENANPEDSKKQLYHLYLGYFIATALCFILIVIFMRKQPKMAPSLGAEQQKEQFLKSLKIIVKDKNLLIFFTGSTFLYGSVLIFASIINIMMKPYGYENTQIAVFSLILLTAGISSGIVFSVYIKKTLNYGRAIMVISLGSLACSISMCVVLNTINSYGLMIFLSGVCGAFMIPLVPICYDLGCELCFPVGQTLVTGIFLGLSMIFAFFATLILTSSLAFTGKRDSLIAYIILSCFFLIGAIFYRFLKIKLKRNEVQKQGKKSEGEGTNQTKQESITEKIGVEKQEIEMKKVLL